MIFLFSLLIMLFYIVVDVPYAQKSGWIQVVVLIASQIVPLVYFFIQYRRGVRAEEARRERDGALQTKLNKLLDTFLQQKRTRVIPDLTVETGEKFETAQGIEAVIAKMKEEIKGLLSESEYVKK